MRAPTTAPMAPRSGCLDPRFALRVGLAASLLVAAACSAAEADAPAAGCNDDLDCLAGQLCGSDGRCVEGGGGGDGPTLACESSDGCRTEPFSSVQEFYWDGMPGTDEVCTSKVVSCPGATTCEAPRSCEPIADGASRPGGAACAADSDCWSGRCLSWQGVGICLRSCAGDGDCPMASPRDRDVGLRCADDVHDNVHFRRCVPIGEDPAATLCRNDGDCPEDRACRFDGRVVDSPEAVPLCLPAPEGGGLPAGVDCPGDDDASACRGDLCMAPCWSADTDDSNPLFCDAEPFRCSAPCDTDADCPSRLACQVGTASHRVGTWTDIGQATSRAGREVKYCLLPPGGCRDEVDCCPTPDPDGSCRGGWATNPQRCTVHLVPPLAAPRVRTSCLDPDGRATPGSCCSAHGDCDSDLCVPAREGSACAGGGVCSTPCDPDPGPDGVYATGDERDRCALRAAEGSYHQGSRCLPLDLELAGADGASWSGVLHVCR